MLCYEIIATCLLGMQIHHCMKIRKGSDAEIVPRFDYSHDDPECNLPIRNIALPHETLVIKIFKNERFKVYCPHCEKYFWTTIRKHLDEGYGCPTCPSKYQDSRYGSKYKASRTTTFKLQMSKVKNHLDNDGELRYGYSRFFWDKKAWFWCKTCKIWFYQLVGDHRDGHGCRRCKERGTSERQVMSLESIVEKTRYKYADRNYELISLDRSDPKKPLLTFKCHDHDRLITKSVYHFIHGGACRDCYIDTVTMTIEEIEQKALIHHDGKGYTDYSVDRSGELTMVSYDCPDHGRQTQFINLHINNGKGCRKCANEALIMTFEEVIERANVHHGDKGNIYHKLERDGEYPMIHYTCGLCEFEVSQSIHGHMDGRGCPNCWAELVRITLDHAIERANVHHGDKGNIYHGINRERSTPFINYTCGLCRFEVSQDMQSHMNGTGCSSCSSNGFDPAKPAIFYYIKFKANDQWLYKLGITNRTVEQRYVSEGVDYTVLMTREFDVGESACKHELMLKRLHKQYRYHGLQVMKCTGNTEIYIKDILEMDFQLD